MGHRDFFNSSKAEGWFFLATGLAALGSVISSAVLIVRHLRTAQIRGEYAYTVRILLMVPVYSVQSYVALVLRCGAIQCSGANELLEFSRLAYECIVIFAFTQLLVFQLGGIENLVNKLDASHCYHLPPLSWVLPRFSWAPQARFVRRTLTSVLLYVPCSLIPSFCVFVSFFWTPAFKVVKPASTGIVNLTQVLAMYGLVLFYHANADALAPIKPIQKLLSIKMLLFFTNVQSFGVKVCKHFGVFDAVAERHNWRPEAFAEGLENAAICIEMFLLALCHHCVYPPGELAVAGHNSTIGHTDEENLPQRTDVYGQPNQEWMEEKMRRSNTQVVDGESRCLLCRRMASALNIRDIPIFYKVLKGVARTASTDALTESPRFIPIVRYMFCGFWFGRGSDSPCTSPLASLESVPDPSSSKAPLTSNEASAAVVAIQAAPTMPVGPNGFCTKSSGD